MDQLEHCEARICRVKPITQGKIQTDRSVIRMSIVRCNKIHGRPKGRIRAYVSSVKPVGYPETGVICGRSGCEEPGLVWLTEQERKRYEKGERIFDFATNTVKVRVE